MTESGLPRRRRFFQANNKHNSTYERRSQNLVRKIVTKTKTKLPKILLLIQESKHQLNVTFPQPNFLMLSSYASMTQYQRSRLTPEMQQFLQTQKHQLQSYKQAMETAIKNMKDAEQECADEKLETWSQNYLKFQRENEILFDKFQAQSKALRKIYLKKLQFNKQIDY